MHPGVPRERSDRPAGGDRVHVRSLGPYLATESSSARPSWGRRGPARPAFFSTTLTITPFLLPARTAAGLRRAVPAALDRNERRPEIRRRSPYFV